MPWKLESCGLSDRGLVREKNEDIWDALNEEAFYALADGMGGHRAGEIAAHKTVESICSMVKAYSYSTSVLQQSKEEVSHLLNEAIQEANKVIRRMAKEEERFTGMGTTVCCLCIRPSFAVCAHVGDSRVYRLRGKELSLLTCDHSLVMDLLQSGQMNQEQAKSFKRKNVITKAVGIDDNLIPTLDTFEVQKGDCYLLCSDGLSDFVSKESIKENLLKVDNLKKACMQLVEQAKGQGSKDNITVLIVKVIDEELREWSGST